jgi:hypothetical protein
LVNRHGRKSGGFCLDVFRRLIKGRFTTVRRSDLAATIYGTLDGPVETIFGDSVASIEEVGSCARVTFDHAPRVRPSVLVISERLGENDDCEEMERRGSASDR